MSKIDDVFDFADELIDEWGQQVQLVIKGDPSYDINTGETTEALTTLDIKAVITKLDQSEIGGLYQANDVKILFDPVQVNYIYPTEADYFIIPRETAPNQRMKIVQCNTYRGDRPVLYVVIARPQ